MIRAVSVNRNQQEQAARRSTLIEHVQAVEFAEMVADLVLERMRTLMDRPQTESLLTRAELAQVINLSESTIDRLVKSGAIPAVGEGKKRRFVASAVIAALSQPSPANSDAAAQPAST